MLKVSATALKLYLQCPARWGFRYLAGRREPSTPALAFGTRAHAIAEEWLRHGVLPGDQSKEERAFLEGIQLLPAPGTVLVETSFDFAFEGIQWAGRIDFEDPAACLVGDHKFVGDTRYALTSETLLTDIQGVLYTLAHPQYHDTHLEWIYYQKKRRGAHAVPCTMSYDYAAEYARAHMVGPALEMTLLHADFVGADAANMLEKRPGECWAYNTPCFHSAICTR